MRNHSTPLRRRPLLTALLAAPAALRAQPSFPSRPIRLVVTFPPGGASDVIGRILSPRIEARFGQPVVIDNRPGAGGNIGMDVVAKAPPDGHTIGIGAAGALAVNPSLYASMPYDPQRDLAPIILLAGIPFVLAASPRLGVRSLAELLARARQGPLTLAHGGNGTAMHLSAELLNQLPGVRIEPVPFRGSGPAVTAVVAGQTDLAMVDLASSLGLARGGQIIPIGVTTAVRLASLPEAPTLAEAGLPGYESVGWFGLLAPVRTPGPVLELLNAAFAAALREPEVVQRLEAAGMVPQPGSAAEFAGFIASETVKWAAVVRAAGTTLD